jgi:hypothetical protein
VAQCPLIQPHRLSDLTAMVQLSAQLQQRLRRIGTVDSSLCRQCVAALAVREEAEAAITRIRATQQQGSG